MKENEQKSSYDDLDLGEFTAHFTLLSADDLDLTPPAQEETPAPEAPSPKPPEETEGPEEPASLEELWDQAEHAHAPAEEPEAEEPAFLPPQDIFGPPMDLEGTESSAPADDAGEEPDVVLAACGDTPTLEVMAAVTILREEMPQLKIRVINVVDLFKLESDHKHPHGLSDREYDALFTKDKPIIFAFHGYPTLIHELTYERHNRNLSVHGYQEEGTITTPFDMRVQNEIDRFNLVKDVIMHLPQLGNKGAHLIQKMNDKLIEHKQYIAEYGQDLEEVRNWEWHLPEA